MEATEVKDPLQTHPLIEGHYDNVSLTQMVFNPVWRKPGRGWWLLFVALVNGILANGNAALNTASRIAYAMSRAGSSWKPSWLGNVIIRK